MWVWRRSQSCTSSSPRDGHGNRPIFYLFVEIRTHTSSQRQTQNGKWCCQRTNKNNMHCWCHVYLWVRDAMINRLIIDDYFWSSIHHLGTSNCPSLQISFVFHWSSLIIIVLNPKQFCLIGSYFDKRWSIFDRFIYLFLWLWRTDWRCERCTVQWQLTQQISQ